MIDVINSLIYINEKKVLSGKFSYPSLLLLEDLWCWYFSGFAWICLYISLLCSHCIYYLFFKTIIFHCCFIYHFSFEKNESLLVVDIKIMSPLNSKFDCPVYKCKVTWLCLLRVDVTFSVVSYHYRILVPKWTSQINISAKTNSHIIGEWHLYCKVTHCETI